MPQPPFLATPVWPHDHDHVHGCRKLARDIGTRSILGGTRIFPKQSVHTIGGKSEGPGTRGRRLSAAQARAKVPL